MFYIFLLGNNNMLWEGIIIINLVKRNYDFIKSLDVNICDFIIG